MDTLNLSIFLKDTAENNNFDKILKEEFFLDENDNSDELSIKKDNKDLSKYKYLLNVLEKDNKNHELLSDIQNACQEQNLKEIQQLQEEKQENLKKWQEKKALLLEKMPFLQNKLNFFNYLDNIYNQNNDESIILFKMIDYGFLNQKEFQNNNLSLKINEKYSANTNLQEISKTLFIGLKLNFCYPFEEDDVKKIFEFIINSSYGKFSLKKTDNPKNFFKIPFISLNMGTKENFLIRFLKINSSFIYFPKYINDYSYFFEKCQIWLGQNNVLYGDIRY